jgi:trimethylamine--corrinoid protein Co-methyltransferase
VDSKLVDVQAAHETTMSALLTALAGANIIYGLGMLEMGITFDYTKLVLDNEFAGMIMKVISGIEVNDETLAVNVIKQVGAAGEFVSHEHTFKHFKAEQSKPKLIDRRMPEDWLASGGKDIVARANEVARDIYTNYRVEPLSEDVRKKLRDIVNEAEDKNGLPPSKA